MLHVIAGRIGALAERARIVEALRSSERTPRALRAPPGRHGGAGSSAATRSCSSITTGRPSPSATAACRGGSGAASPSCCPIVQSSSTP